MTTEVSILVTGLVIALCTASIVAAINSVTRAINRLADKVQGCGTTLCDLYSMLRHNYKQ